jgi:hypothetical protein
MKNKKQLIEVHLNKYREKKEYYANPNPSEPSLIAKVNLSLSSSKLLYAGKSN